MKTETMLRTTSKQRLTITFVIIALILAIPLVAIQFTEEVDWNLFDFILMGTLLTVTGLAIELVTRTVKATAWRIGISVVILVLLLLTWAELAVGIFGTPFAGN